VDHTDLYRDLGLSKMQMVTMIQKAKRLVKSGIVPPNDFKEIKVADSTISNGPCSGVELVWGNGKLIRFAQAEIRVKTKRLYSQVSLGANTQS
jgi:hypothetical protein